MLVDKYKPLRTSSIQTADENIKKALPTLPVNLDGEGETGLFFKPDSSPKPSTGSWATEPLLPSTPGHQPWHTTFRAPPHSGSLSKYAQMPGPSISSKSLSVDLTDGHSRVQKQKAQHAGRLTPAMESTLDYRIGIRKSEQGIPNPVTLKGWASLVEEKIEKARQAGLFKNVKGHGRPLVQSIDEHNLFVAREEFLMNRIVQRNGAAPPWVVVQGELEAAVETFRQILRQTWIRRTLCLLTLTHTAVLPHP